MDTSRIRLIALWWVTSEQWVWTQRELGGAGFWKGEEKMQFWLGWYGAVGCSEAACWALWLILCEAFPKQQRFCVLLMSTAQEAVFAS